MSAQNRCGNARQYGGRILIHRMGYALLSVLAGLWFFLLSPALAADHRDSPQVDNGRVDRHYRHFHVSGSGEPGNAGGRGQHPPRFRCRKRPPAITTIPTALYRFRFHTNTTAVPTSQIDFVFTPFTTSQSFTAYFPHGIVVQGPVTLATVNPTPPTPLVTNGPQGIMIYAGPREDPFVFDVVGFDRFVAGLTPNFTGANAFAGFNVNSIVIEVPLSLVVGSAQQFGVWAVTYDVLNGSPTQLQQVDRMGNPAISTALIPAALKDAFNSGNPAERCRQLRSDDPEDARQFQHPAGECGDPRIGCGSRYVEIQCRAARRISQRPPSPGPAGRYRIAADNRQSGLSPTVQLRCRRPKCTTPRPSPISGSPAARAAAPGTTAPGDCATLAGDSLGASAKTRRGFAWPAVADTAKPRCRHPPR